jgi:hypothetical protein
MSQPLTNVILNKQRWLHSFQSRDGSEEILFPRGDHEWDSTQSLRLANSNVIGTSYAFDLLGHSLAPKDVGIERIRYTILGNPTDVDAELDNERATMYEFGTGRLWSRDKLDTKRWAWARLSEMPSISIGPKDNNIVPVSVSFVRLSDWYSETPEIFAEDIIASPHEIQIDNTGNAMITNIQLEIRSNAGAPSGFHNPKITNAVTGEWFQINRISTTDQDILKIAMQEYKVEFSSNGGTTFQSDYANLEMGTTQVGLMRFIRGTNVIRYEDDAVPNVNLSLNYFLTYH